MYTPEPFEETRVEVMHELIRSHPLATVVTQSANGINANHIPLHLSESPAPLGALHGHVARANPLLDDVRDTSEVLTIFHGPEAYITPSWYATKKETGRVAPTWNYAVVHAYGRLRIVDDASWLRTQLDKLTAHNEAAFSSPWRISDAPKEFVEKLMSAIVGVEIIITSLLGKWKVSQNQPPENQRSVISGLRESGQTASEAMAVLVENTTKNRLRR